MTTYAQHVSTRRTPQSEPIPGHNMTANNAGGYSFAVDDWTRLERFLILGSEKGSYYVGARELTVENAECVLRCAQEDPQRTVETIASISEQGRAPKNDPAIFALAMVAGIKGETGRIALDALNRVCRTGTHLFQFAESVEAFRGWGRSLRRAVQNWYLHKPAQQVAYQITKYQQRNGWSHRDLLRLSHPKCENRVLGYAVGKDDGPSSLDDQDDAMRLLAAVECAKTADKKQIVQLIRDHGLVRECIPTRHLGEPEVWEALLENMPVTAMVRNLATMTKIGLLKPLSAACNQVLDTLNDEERLRKSRIHPIQILLALKTYASGRGFRGSSSWDPVPQIVDALDGAFYKTFQNVEPTGKRWLLGVDVSGSMSMASAADNLSCAEAAGAVSTIVANTEPNYYIHGFAGEFRDLGISKGQRLDDVLQKTRSMNFGRTDCALPMTYALQNRLEVDVFLISTDNETWYGNIHPVQALNEYRQKTGIPAKLIVAAFEPNEFSIADPNDAGMLDIAGFDASVPKIIGDFAR